MIDYKFDLIPSEHDPRDHVIESVFLHSMQLPESFSWAEKMLPVADQGAQGSCSAMTAKRIKEVQEFIEVGMHQPLSAQYVYNLRSNRGEGMTPRDTMRILSHSGIVKERLYPYGSREKINESLRALGRHLRINDYAQVNTIEAAKMSLLANGPVYFALPVYNATREVFWEQEHPGQKMLGGHAVALIGWDEKGFWGVNSWGENWGREGFFLFPYEHWGIQWEAWTAYDADTCVDTLYKQIDKYLDGYQLSQKRGCFPILFKWK